MTVLILCAFAGVLAGMVAFAVCWAVVANRSDRGMSTGPLPIMPPPAPPIPADLLVGYQPRHRALKETR